MGVFFSGSDWGLRENRTEQSTRDILNENLVQSAQDLGLGQRFNFEQDNDPKHTSPRHFCIFLANSECL